MKKRFIVLFVFLMSILVTAPAFAEKHCSLIGTYGFGFTTFSNDYFDDVSVALSVDFDLVSKLGFTISLGNMVNFVVGQYIYNNPYIGIGYRYLADKWDFGLSIICVPLEFVNDALVGVKITGGYWINDNFGLNLSMMLGGGAVSSIESFSMRSGVSIKL